MNQASTAATTSTKASGWVNLRAVHPATVGLERWKLHLAHTTSSRRCASRPDNPEADVRKSRNNKLRDSLESVLVRGPANLERIAGGHDRPTTFFVGLARGIARHMVVTRHQLCDVTESAGPRFGSAPAVNSRAVIGQLWMPASMPRCYTASNRLARSERVTCGRQFLTGLVCQAIGRVPVRNSGSG